jgi:hypothetical protein
MVAVAVYPVPLALVLVRVREQANAVNPGIVAAITCILRTCGTFIGGWEYLGRI